MKICGQCKDFQDVEGILLQGGRGREREAGRLG